MKLENIFNNIGKACGHLVYDGIKVSGDILGKIQELSGKDDSAKKSRELSQNIAIVSSEITQVCFGAVGIITDYAILGGIELLKSIKENAYVKDVVQEGEEEVGKIVEPVSFELLDEKKSLL